MTDLERAAVVIPVFNEEGQIAEVIEAAQAANSLFINTERIIVVDNNSSDKTRTIAETMGALVVDCPEQGKGQAMSAGVERAKQLGLGVVTFLDGDLTNLKGSHVNLLTEPVVERKTPMAVGIIDLWDNWLLKHIPWPSISGQRSMNIDTWDRLEPGDRRGFYIETAMNVRAIEQGWFNQIQSIRLEGVNHDKRRKIKEQGVIQGSMEYMQTYGRALVSYWRASRSRSR